MMDYTDSRFVATLELFAEHERRSIKTVSRLATGSGDTVDRLRRGGTITTRRMDRALRYLSEHWPEDLAWPAHTPRPNKWGNSDRETIVPRV